MVVQTVKNVFHNLQKAPPAQVQDVPASEPKDWTVLTYMEGRHRLAHSTDLALNKLEKVGTTDKVNLVVQATQVPTWQELTLPNMQSLPTRRYVVTKDDDTNQVSSPVVQEFPEQVRLNEDSLADFVKWGMEKFPARHTMLVIKKHGAGFAKISNGDDDFAPLSAREVAGALAKAGKKVDVVAFDSCSMQQLEVAYQLRNGAEVMAGSQEDIKAVAYPYDVLAERLNARPQATAREAGKLVVDVHRGQPSIHGAADLTKLGGLQETMKTFVEAVKAEKVAPELLYTRMASVAPIERKSLGISFDFRDLGTFLTDVGGDERFPQSVRDAANEARISLDGSLVAQYASPARQELKSPTGLSTYMPWKAPSDKLHDAYGQLDWARDSGWGELLDYVHTERPKLSVPADVAPSKEETLSLAQSMGKWGLYQYKKYISPYLEARCAYTPSCSQYAREAIETHGLTEGMKLGFLRLVSCDGHNKGADPVPGGHTCGPDCGCGTPQIREDLLIAPPPRADKSELRQRAEGFATQAAATAGSVLGGLGLGLVAAPIGAAVGAYFGYKAGTDTIDGLTAEMLPKYGEPKVRAYLKLARPVGMPAYNLHQKVEAWTGSKMLATVVGGIAGGVSGAVLGLGGGALQGYNWGSAFGRLWALNRTREAFGEMPTDPRTEAILKRDYEK